MTPLKYLTQINPATPEFDRLPPEAEVSFVPLDAVWPSGVDAHQHRKKASVATGYTRFLEGDIVLPKITPTFQADRTTLVTGVEGGVAAGTTELHVVRVGAAADARYVRYLLSSRPFLHGGTAEMIGVAGQKRVPESWLREFLVPIESLAAQHAIADYLDTETARIDTLIDKKRRLSTLLEARFQDRVSQVLWETEAKTVRLKHLCGSPSSGNRNHQSFVEGDGIPCLRGLNIRAGRIQREELLSISEDTHARQRATQLRAGDLVIVRSGLAGAAAVVPEDLAGANCVDLVVVRQSPQVLPAWLEYVINSREAQEQVVRRQAGAILIHFNAVDAGELWMPRVSISVQRAAVAVLNKARHNRDVIVSRLDRQIKLLQEHRQALITAAVTGELDVSRVA